MPYGIDSPNSKHWDRELEDGLPDCRLRQENRQRLGKILRGIHFEKVFCANCGCDGGMVTAAWSPHVFYLCNECDEKLRPVGVIAIPESSVR